MMGPRENGQGQFFYSFDLDEVVPSDHLVRQIDGLLDLGWVHKELAPYYSHTGRPSIDPALMIRMLILGYVFAIRSERALCREVQVNLAYRWFCGLGIEDRIPDHSAFTRARNERFRDHDVFRHVFEHVVASCIKAGLVGGDGFAVDASLIAADANKCRSTPGDKWSHDIDPTRARRAVQDYLANLDNPAWGRASDVVPKFVAPSDPAAQWTGALRNAAFFAYADNYLIDIKFGIIMDVEASRAIRQSEVGASQTMIERTEKKFGITPDWLVADTAYGSAPNLHFLVDVKGIAPHIPVIDKSQRNDGTFSRDDFIYDKGHDHYVCLSGKILPRSSGARGPRGDDAISYFSRVADCRDCLLKSKCCPNSPSRKITRHVHEEARDAARAIAKTAAYQQTRRDRKKVEMLFAHLKRILRLGRLRLRGPAGAQFEFTLAAIAQNLRRLAKLALHPPDTAVPCVA
ncbi:MAG TPA: IS1182 family transposase [Methyloceanibacter sp.]|nr:IS1182 family transposase [Methyloceanibacter sp.]